MAQNYVNYFTYYETLISLLSYYINMVSIILVYSKQQHILLIITVSAIISQPFCVHFFFKPHHWSNLSELHIYLHINSLLNEYTIIDQRFFNLLE